MSEVTWGIRLSAAAERDFANVLDWTEQAFGRQQAEIYRDLLISSVAVLLEGPDAPGSRDRDEILPGLRTLHIGRPGRHFILYRVAGSGLIEVLRILHDAMDIQRHVPPQQPDNQI